MRLVIETVSISIVRFKQEIGKTTPKKIHCWIRVFFPKIYQITWNYGVMTHQIEMELIPSIDQLWER